MASLNVRDISKDLMWKVRTLAAIRRISMKDLIIILLEKETNFLEETER